MPKFNWPVDKTTRILSLLAILAVLARLFLAWRYYGNFDQESYTITAQIVERAGNVYAETHRYNYSPVWSFVLFSLYKSSAFLGVTFHFMVRSFLTVIDLLIAVILSRIALNPRVGLFYLINPVSLLLTGYHGQFENLAFLPLLIAIFIQQHKKDRWVSVLILGTLSILIKHITLFGVLALYWHVSKSKRQFALMALASTVIFLMSFLPYLPEGRNGILENVFLYSGVPRAYGLPSFFDWTTWMFLAVMVVIFFAFAKIPFFEWLELSFVSFLVFAPGMSQQQFLLPVIPGTLYRRRAYWLFTAAAAFFILSSEAGLDLPTPAVWNSVWIAAVIWFVSLVLSYLNVQKLRSSHSWQE